MRLIVDLKKKNNVAVVKRAIQKNSESNGIFLVCSVTMKNLNFFEETFSRYVLQKLIVPYLI